MKYRIEISYEAQTELHEAYLWIHRDSPNNASRWRMSLLDTIRTLADLPQRCEVAPESSFLHKEIRQSLHGKRQGVYRILFTIEQDVVYILLIRHAARRFLGESGEAESEDNDIGGQ